MWITIVSCFRTRTYWLWWPSIRCWRSLRTATSSWSSSWKALTNTWKRRDSSSLASSFCPMMSYWRFSPRPRTQPGTESKSIYSVLEKKKKSMGSNFFRFRFFFFFELYSIFCHTVALFRNGGKKAWQVCRLIWNCVLDCLQYCITTCSLSMKREKT